MIFTVGWVFSACFLASWTLFALMISDQVLPPSQYVIFTFIVVAVVLVPFELLFAHISSSIFCIPRGENLIAMHL